MATPLGHALAGYAISRFSRETHHDNRNRFHWILLAVLVAMTPDLDVLPGLIQGKPVMYHGGISHSLGVGLAISLIIAGTSYLKGGPFAKVFRLCFISYVSHLLLDFFGPDKRIPYGIPLFWPLSGEHYLSPIPLLLGVHHAGSTFSSTLEFLKGLLSPYNLAAITLEVIVTAPFIYLGKPRGSGEQKRA